MGVGLADVIRPDLPVVFCGINPGVRAAASGHHFEGRGNRFWRVLHLAGFTPLEIAPEDDRAVLQYGCGLTTLVERPTTSERELTPEEFDAAGVTFRDKIQQFTPRVVAFLGKAGYAALFNDRRCQWGPQDTMIGRSTIWVLPNPSGRNLAFGLQQLIEAYQALRVYLDAFTARTPRTAPWVA